MAKKTMSFSERLQATLDRHNREVKKNAELMAQARARVLQKDKKDLPPGVVPLSALFGRKS